MSRRRSVSSQENDERLLEAALEEIAAVGVDRLGMSGVARRAGLTTGALYGRYENVYELAAAVWTTRVRDTHFALLDRAVRALVDDDRSIPLDEVIQELVCPSRSTIAALELLATARRIDELDEVVTPAVDEWMQGWRAGAHGRDRRRRAQVLFTAGSVWGVLLHTIPRHRETEWEPVMVGVRYSFGRPYAAPIERFRPEVAGTVRADTGDAAQSALIDSVSAITARVGFERADDVADRAPRRTHVGRDLRALPDQGRAARALGRGSARPAPGRRSRSEQRHVRRARRRARHRAHRRRVSRRAGAANGGRSGSRRSSRRGTVRIWPPRSTRCRKRRSTPTSKRWERVPPTSTAPSTRSAASPNSSPSASRSSTSSPREWAAPTGERSSFPFSRHQAERTSRVSPESWEKVTGPGVMLRAGRRVAGGPRGRIRGRARRDAERRRTATGRAPRRHPGPPRARRAPGRGLPRRAAAAGGLRRRRRVLRHLRFRHHAVAVARTLLDAPPELLHVLRPPGAPHPSRTRPADRGRRGGVGRVPEPDPGPAQDRGRRRGGGDVLRQRLLLQRQGRLLRRRAQLEPVAAHVVALGGRAVLRRVPAAARARRCTEPAVTHRVSRYAPRWRGSWESSAWSRSSSVWAQPGARSASS